MFAQIQDLLARDDLPIINVFKCFEVLSIQYRDAQTLEPLRPWNGQFSNDFTFWDDINFKATWQLAEYMTKKHMEDFTCSDSLIEEIWTFLSNDVRECALADGSLVPKLADLERVSS